MPKLKDLCIVAGTYEKDGATKKRWLTIGALMSTNDGGQYILLDPMINLAAVPREEGRDRVMVSLFDADRQSTTASSKPVHGDDRYKAAQQMQAPSGDFDSDIPF